MNAPDRSSGDDRTGELALVMSGGGARAAYQVGLLRWLARHRPELHLPILTGVSAGAINAAYLAAHSGDSFRVKVDALSEIWSTLTAEQVFRVDSRSLTKNVLRVGLKLVSGGSVTVARPNAFVDTSPLWVLLEALFGNRDEPLPGVERNLASGALKALAITASSYSTGQSITWVQGRNIEQWERAHRKSVVASITPKHIAASAALPLFFPAVQVEHLWYGDGGMRLTAPLSPAVHLGARKILAISTRYGRSRVEADHPTINGYPPIAQVIGALFNALFLDLFDADALSMERVNRLIEVIPPELRGGMRPIRLLVLRPSRDLGKLANEYEVQLPTAFRFMTRGLGTRETRSNDLLSLVMFQPDYLTRLIELGEADAEARRAEIAAFLDDEVVPAK